MYISYCIFRFKEIAASFSVVGKLQAQIIIIKKENIITCAFLKYFTLIISWLKYILCRDWFLFYYYSPQEFYIKFDISVIGYLM